MREWGRPPTVAVECAARLPADAGVGNPTSRGSTEGQRATSAWPPVGSQALSLLQFWQNGTTTYEHPNRVLPTEVAVRKIRRLPRSWWQREHRSAVRAACIASWRLWFRLGSCGPSTD